MRKFVCSSFEASPALMGCCEVVTAFEVFEHLADPLGGIEEMLAYSRHLLFTTELVRDTIPLPDNWWYYGTEHGQHLSFFSLESLQSIARNFLSIFILMVVPFIYLRPKGF
jgi:hypothetical protein